MGKELVRLLRKNGWSLDKTGGGHIKARPPGGGRFVVLSSTSSDYREHMNAIALIRRAGYELDGSPRKRHDWGESVDFHGPPTKNLTADGSAASVIINNEIRPDEPVGARWVPGATAGRWPPPRCFSEEAAGSGEGEQDMANASAATVDLVTLGNEAKAIRVDAGLTQVQLSELMGVEQWTVSNVERGSSVSIESAKAFVELLREQGVEGLRKQAEAMGMETGSVGVNALPVPTEFRETLRSFKVRHGIRWGDLMRVTGIPSPELRTIIERNGGKLRPRTVQVVLEKLKTYEANMPAPVPAAPVEPTRMTMTVAEAEALREEIRGFFRRTGRGHSGLRRDVKMSSDGWRNFMNGALIYRQTGLRLRETMRRVEQEIAAKTKRLVKPVAAPTPAGLDQALENMKLAKTMFDQMSAPAPASTFPRPVEMPEQRIAVSEPMRMDGVFVAKGEDLTKAFRLDGKTKHVVVEGFFVRYISE